tara:strand:- start:85 stop:618 length:534 start_codon:yes stop_codon:yes gene_type:complete
MDKIRKFNIKIFIVLTTCFFFISSCGIYKSGSNSRDTPTSGMERAKKNVSEGRGISIGNVLKRGKTSYEFSTSNPLWRASLDVLDFMPLSTVDYSGGLIITDWYSDNRDKNEPIKITVRFLSNEVRSDSITVMVHKKKCTNQNNCSTQLLDSKIKEELIRTILARAATIEKKSKQKK